VAKDVNLVAVRVLNCDGGGTIAGVISGIDWITANHVPRSMANASLTAFTSTAPRPGRRR
jgi:hypothetical protein